MASPLVWENFFDKATEKNRLYYTVSHVHADINDYHKILSGLYLEQLIKVLWSLIT